MSVHGLSHMFHCEAEPCKPTDGLRVLRMHLAPQHREVSQEFVHDRPRPPREEYSVPIRRVEREAPNTRMAAEKAVDPIPPLGHQRVPDPHLIGARASLSGLRKGVIRLNPIRPAFRLIRQPHLPVSPGVTSTMIPFTLAG